MRSSTTHSLEFIAMIHSFGKMDSVLSFLNSILLYFLFIFVSTGLVIWLIFMHGIRIVDTQMELVLQVFLGVIYPTTTLIYFS